MNQPVLLVVDDEPGVRQALQLVFNKNFRVIEAHAAADAVQLATEERPDVILLDIVMPGIDGLEILKQLKAVQPDCPVIMLTALNTARAAFTALEGLKATGLTLLIAEQQVPLALSVADRGYVLENGRVRLQGSPSELEANPEVRRAYLGVA